MRKKQANISYQKYCREAQEELKLNRETNWFKSEDEDILDYHYLMNDEYESF